MIMKEYNNVSKWFVGLSVLLVVVGIVMVVWPNLTIDLLGAMTGICMLVIGLVYVIMYLAKVSSSSFSSVDISSEISIVTVLSSSGRQTNSSFICLIAYIPCQILASGRLFFHPV